MPVITDVKGIGPMLAIALVDHGIETVPQLGATPLADLMRVPGIKEARAVALIAAAQGLLAMPEVPEPQTPKPKVAAAAPKAKKADKKKSAKKDAGKTKSAKKPKKKAKTGGKNKAAKPAKASKKATGKSKKK